MIDAQEVVIIEIAIPLILPFYHVPSPHICGLGYSEIYKTWLYSTNSCQFMRGSSLDQMLSGGRAGRTRCQRTEANDEILLVLFE